MTALRAMAAVLLMALILAMAATAVAQEDSGGVGPGFKEGDIITMDKIDAIKAYLPAEFWANRDFFFYEGMQLTVGPFYEDYSAAEEYLAATQKFRGQAKHGAGRRGHDPAHPFRN